MLIMRWCDSGVVRLWWLQLAEVFRFIVGLLLSFVGHFRECLMRGLSFSQVWHFFNHCLFLYEIMVFALTVQHVSPKVVRALCESEIWLVSMPHLLLRRQIAIGSTNCVQARVLIEQLVVSLSWVKHFERQMSQWKCSMPHTEEFTDELSEVMFALDKQVCRLFNSYIELFLLKLFFASDDDEELVRHVHVSLELQLEGHIGLVRCDSRTVDCDARIPLLTVECSLIVDSFIKSKLFHLEVWFASTNCGRLTEKVGWICDRLRTSRWRCVELPAWICRHVPWVDIQLHALPIELGWLSTIFLRRRDSEV